ILLDLILPDPRQWQVTILGTDVNPRFLKKALAGVFGEWSFRDAPSWLKEGYFTEVGDRARRRRLDHVANLVKEHPRDGWISSGDGGGWNRRVHQGAKRRI